MKEIKIVSRWDSSKILLCGKYESIKDCLEKNRDAYLGGADLRGAYLRGADLGGAYLGGAYLGGAYLGGAYLRDAYLRGADLGGADLRGAYLRGADLGGADLGGADLRDAYLRGAKNYCKSHDFWIELIRRHSVKDFTQAEWAIIGQVYVMKLCWDTIKKDYKKIKTIFEKLAKDGFDEYLKEYEEVCQQ